MNEEPARGPGIAVRVIPMPSGIAAPTDIFPAMIAWLYRHGGPRTGEVLTRLEHHGWQLELPDPGAGTQTELWAFRDSVCQRLPEPAPQLKPCVGAGDVFRHV